MSADVILSRQFLQEVEDRAYDLLTDMEDAMVEALIDSKGLAYGDIELSRSQRILRFLDEDQSGVLDSLKAMFPDEYENRLKTFLKDVEGSGVI